MNELIVLITILFLTVAGFSILRGFKLIDKKDLLFGLSISYGLGVGLISLQLYFYSRLGIPWSRISILLPWFIFLVALGLLKRKEFIFTIPQYPRFSLIEKILLFSIGVTLFYVLFEALLRPVMVWDGWATWLFEAKAFFLDGKISYENLHYMSATYPLLYPLLGTFTYSMLGTVDDTAVLLLSFAFYFFLSLSFFSVIRKRYGYRYALFWTFLLMTIQNFIRHGGRIEAGIADLPQGYFIFTTAMLLLDYLKKSTTSSLVLLGMFLGFTVLIKNEGTPYFFIVVSIIMFHIVINKLYRQVFVLLIPGFFFIDWELFKKVQGLDKLYFTGHHFLVSWKKTIDTFYGVIHELLTITSWNVLWIIYFFTILFTNWKKYKELIIVNGIILIQLAIYVFVYLTTYANGPDSSIERLLIHVFALTMFSISITFYETFSWFLRKLLR